MLICPSTVTRVLVAKRFYNVRLRTCPALLFGGRVNTEVQTWEVGLRPRCQASPQQCAHIDKVSCLHLLTLMGCQLISRWRLATTKLSHLTPSVSSGCLLKREQWGRKNWRKKEPKTSSFAHQRSPPFSQLIRKRGSAHARSLLGAHVRTKKAGVKKQLARPRALGKLTRNLRRGKRRR